MLNYGHFFGIDSHIFGILVKDLFDYFELEFCGVQKFYSFLFYKLVFTFTWIRSVEFEWMGVLTWNLGISQAFFLY